MNPKMIRLKIPVILRVLPAAVIFIIPATATASGDTVFLKNVSNPETAAYLDKIRRKTGCLV
jgi:hypothetical protein